MKVGTFSSSMKDVRRAPKPVMPGCFMSKSRLASDQRKVSVSQPVFTIGSGVSADICSWGV